MEDKYVHAHCKWYAKEARDILERLETDPEQGLASAEVLAQTEEFGLNVLPARKRTSAFVRFLMHFHDILIYILFSAALVTLVLRHYADTAVIIGVAVINAAIGFFQESKAEKALDSIKAMLSDKATVIRDGVRQDVDADRLTLGDIVLLSQGEKVPADLRLLRAERLKIDEAALTGESEPVEKQILPLEYDAVLAERSNMAYSGTAVSYGAGLGVVVDIGEETEIGHISQLMEEVDTETTPLIRQTQALGKLVAVVIVLASVAVYLFGHFFRDYAPVRNCCFPSSAWPLPPFLKAFRPSCPSFWPLACRTWPSARPLCATCLRWKPWVRCR